MPIADSVVLGRNVSIPHPALVNLYGCEIGDESKIGTFVEIQKNVMVGCRCKVSSHSFLCEGVSLGDGVFIGHGVVFINDRFPSALNEDGTIQTEADWTVIRTIVGNNVSIGSGAVVMCGITIKDGATVGAGAVVTRDVAPKAIVAGVPARILSQQSRSEET